MTDTRSYIVTRSGREVMRGEEADLLNAARQGRLLSNDLVYDARTSQWSFARSVSLLKGFPLRDRIESQPQDDVDFNIADAGRRFLDQKAILQRLMKVLGVILAISLFAWSLFLIPDTRKDKENDGELSKVLELDEREMKIEGTGNGVSDTANRRKGSSNMDKKSVVVDGEYDPEMEIDGEGRRAALSLTPEEAEALAAQGNAEGGEGVEGAESEELEDVVPTDLSPSIEPPPPPEENFKPSSMVQPEEDEQPYVYIRPKLEDLQQQLRAQKKIAEQKSPQEAQANSEELTRETGTVLSKLAAMKKTTKKSDEQRELEAMAAAIRNDVLKSCTELSDGKRCELLVAHPEWSTAVIDAIVRKDVILGMTPEQVELSVGRPLERREQSPLKLWCYDDACDTRVEFRDDRVLVSRQNVVQSDSSIEAETEAETEAEVDGQPVESPQVDGVEER